MKRLLSADARALLIAGFCVAGFEGALALNLPHHIDPRTVYPFYSFYAPPGLEGSVLQRQMDILFSKEMPPVDVLLLGDSSCLMSIHSRQLQEITGSRVWNMGNMAWLYTDGHAKILETYLENYQTPRAVIYNVSSYLLTTPLETIKAFGYFDKFQNWLSLEKNSSASLWPAYNLRHYLTWKLNWWLMPQRFLSRPRGPFPSDHDLRRVLIENQGHLDEPRQSKVGEVSNTRYRFSRDCLPGLERLFQLVDEHQISLYLVLNPLPQSYQSARMDSDLENIAQELEALAKKHRYAHIRRPFARYFPDESFGSLFHLTPLGARQNTRELGVWLRKVLLARG